MNQRADITQRSRQAFRHSWLWSRRDKALTISARNKFVDWKSFICQLVMNIGRNAQAKLNSEMILWTQYITHFYGFEDGVFGEKLSGRRHQVFILSLWKYIVVNIQILFLLENWINVVNILQFKLNESRKVRENNLGKNGYKGLMLFNDASFSSRRSDNIAANNSVSHA